MSDSNEVEIRVYGPAVTPETTRDIGEACIDLMDTIAEIQGLPRGLVRMIEPQISCDGKDCSARRDWNSDATGWVNTSDGRDYCPACWAPGHRDETSVPVPNEPTGEGSRA